jgi:hypothetical protein
VSFQVTNQLKILPTAFFSALYLHRRLSRRQWISLPGLALGVAIVNSATNGSLDTHGGERFGAEWWAGLLAAVTAAVLSGYAGVYCERLLKTGTGPEPTGAAGGTWGGAGQTGRAAGGAASASTSAQRVGGTHGVSAERVSHARCMECAERGGGGGGASAPPVACACTAAGRGAARSPRTPLGRMSAVPLSLVRPVPCVPLLTLNIQLSGWGAALAGAQVYALHGPHANSSHPGPLHGFGGYAWAVVGLQALGGLVVSMVMCARLRTRCCAAVVPSARS